MREMVFNELTIEPLAKDFEGAYSRVEKFIATYKQRPALFDKRVRLDCYIGNIQLTNTLSFQDFCKNPAGRTLGSLILGLGKHPFIDEDTPQEESYIENEFIIQRNGKNVSTIGLAAAYLGDSICIGFASESLWNNLTHSMQIIGKNGSSVNTIVFSVSTIDHFSSEEMLKWVTDRTNIQLIKTDMKKEDKTINIRDDHGKDVLTEFSKKLVSSPYILKVVNSLPFNPRCGKFIKATKQDGLIEIVLCETDAGYGLVAQSTGRNLAETIEISRIIERDYR